MNRQFFEYLLSFWQPIPNKSYFMYKDIAKKIMDNKLLI